jgi:hypothetical protein
VYPSCADGVPVFVEVDAPTDDEPHALQLTLITRLMKLRTRQGVLVELAALVPQSASRRRLRQCVCLLWVGT